MADRGGKESRKRRDELLKHESEIQQWWTKKDVFKADAKESVPLPGEKFIGNFPFPYMNGMPIKASADKLTREIDKFGYPPLFPVVIKEENNDDHEPDAKPEGGGKKFKGKKSKAVAKTGRNKFQWEIMQSYHLTDEKIAKFRDPNHWLEFFPPKAVEDLKAFGLGCDWRRTFITTNKNPYFDAFPCADHDRASGEGVMPQEHTLIKMEVVSPFPTKMSVLEGKKVYLVAAILRPETMYGQTNAWVLPGGKYGAFEVNDTEVFILTRRAALNLAYQRLSRVLEKPTCLVELIGKELVGLPLRSLLDLNEIIYTLPMLSVFTEKGTGIVTSVPRIIPIIDHPEFGDKSAERICIEKKIKSQNEREKLDEAKKIIYKEGFYKGTMKVGEYVGIEVKEVKGLIQDKLLKNNQAVVFVSREKRSCRDSAMSLLWL
ncbi:OLC1v1036986C1 [Oldenlandia corymbosa var. corymbosa]|uniref:OLC1v1036986C1 n=1 Tax=Oldenlandia corymbosa var. corymbosa TaxID=529605 RepID=A0AAV1CWN5_OLDCO|nr:OLC1v1036986C1 [Oldenlandia corymbosa var. corymbosa]